MNINDIRKDLEIMVDGQPHVVIDFHLVKPGKGQAFTRVKIKNIDTGAVNERTYKSDEKLELADVEHRQFQFAYSEGTDFVFFDPETGKEITVSGDKIAHDGRWLSLDANFEVIIYKGRAIGFKIPSHVVLQVVNTDLEVKGGATKSVILSTGALLDVPLFVQEGEWVKVDTSGDGIYVERVTR